MTTIVITIQDQPVAPGAARACVNARATVQRRNATPTELDVEQALMKATSAAVKELGRANLGAEVYERSGPR